VALLPGCRRSTGNSPKSIRGRLIAILHRRLSSLPNAAMSFPFLNGHLQRMSISVAAGPGFEPTPIIFLRWAVRDAVK
jgi:hypothetical protein